MTHLYAFFTPRQSDKHAKQRHDQSVALSKDAKIAAGLGIATPVEVPFPLNMQFPANASEGEYQSKSAAGLDLQPSKALSILANPVLSIDSLKVAILVAQGFDEKLLGK